MCTNAVVKGKARNRSNYGVDRLKLELLCIHHICTEYGAQ